MKLIKFNPWNWLEEEERNMKNFPSRFAGSKVARRSPSMLYQDAFWPFGNAFSGMWPELLPEMTETRAAAHALPFYPSLDICGNEKEYKINVELPGVKADEIKVDVQNRSLIISGEKRLEAQENKEDESGFYRIERNYGSFQRVLALPEDADVDNMHAAHKDGVLNISIPRKSYKSENKKSIEIQQG